MHIVIAAEVIMSSVKSLSDRNDRLFHGRMTRAVGLGVDLLWIEMTEMGATREQAGDTSRDEGKAILHLR